MNNTTNTIIGAVVALAALGLFATGHWVLGVGLFIVSGAVGALLNGGNNNNQNDNYRNNNLR